MVEMAVGRYGDQILCLPGQPIEKVRTEPPSPIDHARAIFPMYKIEIAALVSG